MLMLSISKLGMDFIYKHYSEIPQYINDGDGLNRIYGNRIDNVMAHADWAPSMLSMCWDKNLCESNTPEDLALALEWLHGTLDIIDQYSHILGVYSLIYEIGDAKVIRTNAIDTTGLTDEEIRFIHHHTTGVFQAKVPGVEYFPVSTIRKGNTSNVMICHGLDDNHALCELLVDTNNRRIISESIITDLTTIRS